MQNTDSAHFQERLLYQIIGSKTVHNVPNRSTNTEIWPRQLDDTLSVSEGMSEGVSESV